jgi:hypothetical protein
MRDLIDILMRGELQPVVESHSRSKCMDCSKPPEIEVLWAEEMEHAWFCTPCFKRWSTSGDGKGEVCATHKVKDGEVPKKWGDTKVKESMLREQIPQHPEPEAAPEEQEEIEKWHKGGEEVDAVIPHEARKEFHGSEWEEATRVGIEVRQELWDRANGFTPQTQHFWDSSHSQLLPAARLMQSHGKEGVWKYLEQYGPMGEPLKCVLAVPGSCLQCRPSAACAQFCYAFSKRGGLRGRGHYADIQAKAEVNDYAATLDPERFAELILRQWKHGKSTQAWGAVNLSNSGKALRLFDRGDIGPAWLKVIKHLNNNDLRTHIFTKRPDLLKEVDPWNVRLLSTDHTNSGLAKKYDLPVAYNYIGESDKKELLELDDKVQVVLPVKGVVSPEEIDGIPKTFGTRLCPIDSGRMKPDKWACPMCDVGTGLGCYHNQVTKEGSKAERPGTRWPKSKEGVQKTKAKKKKKKKPKKGKGSQ